MMIITISAFSFLLWLNFDMRVFCSDDDKKVFFLAEKG